MSTPQNPNDPNNGQPNPNDPVQDSQDAAAANQGQGQAPQNEFGQHTGQDPQAGQADPHSAYQQGTYDPNAYQAQAYQQGSASAPNAYQHGAAQQAAYSQPAPGQPAYGQPAYGQPAYGQAPQQGSGEAGFFKSLFDIRFDNFIAVKWAGFIYIIAIIFAVLSYLATIVAGISAGVAAGSAASYFTDGPSFSILPLILSIIFGWIIPALWVIGVRLVLELIVSNIKTAEHTKKIADSVSR